MSDVAATREWTEDVLDAMPPEDQRKAARHFLRVMNYLGRIPYGERCAIMDWAIQFYEKSAGHSFDDSDADEPDTYLVSFYPGSGMEKMIVMPWENEPMTKEQFLKHRRPDPANGG